MAEAQEAAKIKKRVIAASSDEDDDVPLIKRMRVATPAEPALPPLATNGQEAIAAATNGDPSAENGPAKDLSQHASPTHDSPVQDTPASSDDEVPLSAAVKPTNGTKRKKPVKKESSGSESEATSLPPAKPRRKPAPKRVKKEEEAPTPKARKTPVPKRVVKREAVDGSEAGEPKEEGDDNDEDEANYWAEMQQEDGGIKWTTLEHNGVLFPPAYQPLPSTVKLIYDGKPVDLSPEAEEVAGFFAAMIDTDHAKKDVFVENFFKDWQAVMEEFPCPDGTIIAEYEKCDFRPMNLWFEAEKARKKTMTKAEKKAEKDVREALEAPYKTCKLNGKVEKVGNFRVEPPSLFRGRGAHPKTGKLKKRVLPEQITINIGKEAVIPKAPDGHQWGKVQHDNTVSWLAMWKENINGAFKYVFLAADSSLKGKSDFAKFEKARKLKDHIDEIRLDYNKEMKDKVMATRQRATAVYLIDRFALRAGNEKGDDEADTVGCCSLKCDNITLAPPCSVTFDFLGKDSIRFHQTFDLDVAVFNNLRIFKKNKEPEDLLFDRLTTASLNAFLRTYMVGLSAKVFRTYNASWTFQQELDKRTKADDSVADKVLAYNRANRDVAVLCNHQRSVSKTHETSMGKLVDKLKALKYQRQRLRWALKNAQERTGDDAVYSEYEEDESDLEDEWIQRHEETLRDKAKETAQKKFEKWKETEAEEAGSTAAPRKDEDESASDAPIAAKGKKGKAKAKKEEDSDDENKKPVVKKKKAFTEEHLQDALEAADEDFKRMRRETETQTVETKKSVAQVLKDLGKKDAAIKAHRNTMVDRDEGKEISLGTSKLNYIDPRLTFAWCKKYDVPIEKMFSKTLREKFTWASHAGPNWRF